ncbi:hypothetical protein Acr_00g0020190 [Actinidia rufa]|uniref:Uncharacterized protein n=1 Tax=Actinidia rufa TaxID=165716 RepID=A0A7J0DBX8_9ERIC|nr:hypothetical protein Acr_00g0020190 [Actinidia rufa]
MTNKINQLPSSPLEEFPPRDEPSDHGRSGKIDNRTRLEREFNIMTQGDLDRLIESYSFLIGIHAKIPEEGETILFTHPGELAFYEAAFHASLRLPIHPTIRTILNFYNIYPTQLSLYAWQSVEGVPRVPRSWNTPGKCCNKLPILTDLEDWRFRRVFRKLRPRGFFKVSVVLNSKTFERCFALNRERMVSSRGDNAEDKSADGIDDVAVDEAAQVQVQAQAQELCQNHGSPPSLDRMRISLKKRDQKVKESKGASSSAKPIPIANGVVIQEKHPKDEVLDISPNQTGSKGKEAMPPFETKKKATSVIMPSVKTSGKVTRLVVPGKGTSANPSTIWRPKASILGSPSMAEKILGGVIPPTNKEKVDKLTLDQAITKSFLVIRNKKMGDEVTLHQGWALAVDGEMSRAQKLTSELKEQLAEVRVREQQVMGELKKVTEDWDATMARLEKQWPLSKRQLLRSSNP